MLIFAEYQLRPLRRRRGGLPGPPAAPAQYKRGDFWVVDQFLVDHSPDLTEMGGNILTTAALALGQSPLSAQQNLKLCFRQPSNRVGSISRTVSSLVAPIVYVCYLYTSSLTLCCSALPVPRFRPEARREARPARAPPRPAGGCRGWLRRSLRCPRVRSQRGCAGVRSCRGRPPGCSRQQHPWSPGRGLSHLCRGSRDWVPVRWSG